jgi:carbamoyltransferase
MKISAVLLVLIQCSNCFRSWFDQSIVLFSFLSFPSALKGKIHFCNALAFQRTPYLSRWSKGKGIHSSQFHNEVRHGRFLNFEVGTLFADISGGYVSPFDLGDSDEDDEEINNDNNALLSVSPDTRLVIGLNKYSHDSSICAADAKTGEVLFYLSKERLSRRKHDGGSTDTLVQTCLDCLNLSPENIDRVVLNNHHYRTLPLDSRSKEQILWQASLGINNDDGGLDADLNLLSDVTDKHEMSHHLAHAYSVAAQAPFDYGLIVVMDGMGETYRAMADAMYRKDTTYTCDLQFLSQDQQSLQQIPMDIETIAGVTRYDWREAESAYLFSKSFTDKQLSIRPVFKRWTEEKTPPVLFNHGFENMESMGAVYSRASTHIFGDWNACGKVMGLAPWQEKWGEKIAKKPTTMQGKLYKDFIIHSDAIVGKPLVGASYDFNDSKEPSSEAKAAILLASSVQADLEKAAIDFVSWLKDKHSQKNLCLAGGVALNSVLNGRISRELGFEKVYIPPYPGDDGIAVGCCAYGLYGNAANSINSSYKGTGASLWPKPLSPYLGPAYDEYDIDEAISWAEPWLEVERIPDGSRRLELVSREIDAAGVVAWFHGRSEAGPRALGHRSILADPRRSGLVEFINNKVKSRESFRPFAPSVLAEAVEEWFEDVKFNSSPYMSITAMVKQEKRALIPAVTHVDGSSRLQTVCEEDEPLYHQLIQTFFKQTRVPMVLNTSFNTLKGEPIVESPKDAIRSFLCSMGSIEMLVIGEYIIKRKDPSTNRLVVQRTKSGAIFPSSLPIKSGPYIIESTRSYNENDGDEAAVPITRVRMPDRPMHNEKDDDGWFTLIDELEAEVLAMCDGKTDVEQMFLRFSEMEFDEEGEGKVSEADQKAIDQVMFQNIVTRLIRLFDHTLVSW